MVGRSLYLRPPRLMESKNRRCTVHGVRSGKRFSSVLSNYRNCDYPPDMPSAGSVGSDPFVNGGRW